MHKCLLFCLTGLLLPFGLKSTAEAQEVCKERTGSISSAVETEGRHMSEKPRLQVAAQKLEARWNAEGLEVRSNARGLESFRVNVRSLGRTGSVLTPMTGEGEVIQEGQTVVVHREGFAEHFSVTENGLRQDFVIADRPGGQGSLMLTLGVEGAAVSSPDKNRVLLRFPGSGRELAYDRLHVFDATGKILPASMAAAGPDIRIQVDDQEAVYPVCIDPTYSDADWDSLGNFPGPNASVGDMVMSPAGDIIIGGLFTAIGDLPANRIAKWDGDEWSTFGEGLNGQVYCLHWVGSDLYVGGKFTRAGNVDVSNIARWDGQNWHAVGGGTNNTVYVIHSMGTDVYAGGLFTTAGGVEASRIARWDGSIWSPLGTGTTGTPYTMAVLNGNLYVGGSFTLAGGVTGTKNIARWTGSAWLAMQGGTSSRVNALLTVGDQLYVGGYFQDTGGRNYIARWSGTSWASLGTGLVNEVQCLAESNGELFVGVGSNLKKWSGGVWTDVGPRLSRDVYAVAVAHGTVYIGGDFASTDTDVYVANLAQLDGNEWEPVGPFEPGMTNYGPLTAFQGKLYIAGTLQDNGIPTIQNLVCWDGQEWSSVGGGVNGTISSMAADSQYLYVAGDMTLAGSTSVSKIARWDGSTWSAVTPTISGTSVTALHVTQTGILFAATSAGYVYRYTGSQWSQVSYRLTTGLVKVITSSATHLYIGGTFTKPPASAGGNRVLMKSISNFDDWQPLGEGLNNEVYALAILDGNVYAGGRFTMAGGVFSPGIAKWNGSQWSQVGSELTPQSGEVRALTVVGGELYAAGQFSGFLGSAAKNIAKWTGTAWQPLGSGLNSLATSLTSVGTSLYVGGVFFQAGDSFGPYLAKLNTLGGPVMSVSGNGQIIARGSDVPELANGTDFGGLNPLHGSVTRTFTISNQGGRALHLDGEPIVSLSGDAGFTLSTLPDTPIEVGENSSFQIIFDPASEGEFAAEVTLESNDLEHPTYSFAIRGGGLSQSEVFAQSVAEAGLENDLAAEDAMPFGDGVTNLAKFAFGMNLAAADVRKHVPGTETGGLPAVTLVEEGLRIEYLRRKGGGLIYTTYLSSTLKPDSWQASESAATVSSVNELWERVVQIEEVSPEEARRLFVLVTVRWPSRL